MKRTLTAALLATSIASHAFAQSGGDSLTSARELYAAARYDEALLVLNGLRPSEGAGAPDRKSIEQYRSLCLLALGRGTEAEEAIAAVITADPLFQPSEAEASPRVRGAFSDVRQRLLPEIAGTRYAAAKASFDRKAYVAAAEQFRHLLTLLDDPDMGTRLRDMRVLAAGFRDLSVAAAAPPPEPRREEPPPPAQPVVPEPQPLRIYEANDAGVSAPASLRQEMPAVPTSIMSQVRTRGTIELVIDEQGRVTAVAIRQPIHPLYDQMLLTAARDWRYRPASLNGTPVKFRKIIHVTVSR